jgi:8-oxo-dGTP diphosphatase
VVDRRVSVGVGCLVFMDGKLLMARRRGVHGDGSWSPPGGALEYGESFEQAARREVEEETGVLIAGLPTYLATTNDVFVVEQRHFVTVWMMASWASGVPVAAAPYELDAVAWVSAGNVPAPLFEPFERLLRTVAAISQPNGQAWAQAVRRLRPFVSAAGLL